MPMLNTVTEQELAARSINPRDTDAAIALLMMSAETCEHNAPIHADGGNQAQADLCRANAASYRAAIARLVP